MHSCIPFIGLFYFMNTNLPAYRVVNNDFTEPPGKLGLLYGEHGVYSTATLVAAEIIRYQSPVVFVDGANRVDPYYLARLARYTGFAPHTFLNRAFVSRAFTCYQMDVALTDGLLEYMQSVNSRVLLIYGPIDLFDDEQVTMRDIVDMIRRIHLAFELLKRHHISTMLVSKTPHFQMKGRERLLLQFKEMSDVIYRLESYDTMQHIIMEKVPYGTNSTNSNALDSARRGKLVEIPAGAQERGSRYTRQIISRCQTAASGNFHGSAADTV
ncbi:MAG TPA: hypothetical protein VMU30_01410 [Bacteroidota bacterium]|nr:hypothetical protein [Bacteroidota bacterium]